MLLTSTVWTSDPVPIGKEAPSVWAPSHCLTTPQYLALHTLEKGSRQPLR